MSTRRVYLTERAGEEKTYTIEADFGGDLGDVLPLAALTTLTLTLFDDATRAIINEVDELNILNANRGAVDAAGHLVCTLEEDDNVILDDSRVEELHVAFFEWTYSNGDKSGGLEVAFNIRNFVKVP